MVELKNVGLDGAVGKKTVHVLSRVNLSLPRRGRVLITGPSGSGKTALLHLISGRERPSRGEILVGGENTAHWKESRLASWRRRTAESDEALLLPDRTVRENAELSARLRGAGSASHAAAREALELLGLSELSECLPDELSGEERRLSALGCALAGDPEILLVDEPCDGMEEQSARRVKELLRAEGERRLVVIATRDEELYFGETVRRLELAEGELVSDSGETGEDGEPSGPAAGGLSAPGLAFRSLGRKSSRVPARVLSVFLSVLLCALALAALGGAERYTANLQAETLSGYPITLTEASVPSGDLESLADWLEHRLDGRNLSLQRSYAISPRMFTAEARQISPVPGTAVSLWSELPDGDNLRQARYSLTAGRWPARYDEAAVILNAQGSLDSACLNALGIDRTAGRSYPELLRMSFRVILPTDEYVQNVDGTWSFLGGDSGYMAALANRALSVKIVGVLTPRTGAAGGSGVGGAAYTGDLTRWVVRSVLDSELVQTQLAAPDRDVISGLPFDTAGVRTADVTEQRSLLQRYAVSLPAERQAALYQELSGAAVEETRAQDTLLRYLETLEEEPLTALYDRLIASGAARATLEENLRSFGATAAETLVALRLYAGSFAYRGTAGGVLRTYSEPVTYDDEAVGIVAAGARLMELTGSTVPTAGVLCCALAALAVILSSALPVASRRRETAILRCRGLSGTAAASALGWESLLLGLLGGVSGAALALVLVRLAAPSLPMGDTWYLPWELAALTAGGGALLSWLSGRLAAGSSADSPGEALRRASL